MNLRPLRLVGAVLSALALATFSGTAALADDPAPSPGGDPSQSPDPGNTVDHPLHQQRGIRAFLDENRDGKFNPGETLVPDISLTMDFCFAMEDTKTFDCKHHISDDRYDPLAETYRGRTTSSGYIAVRHTEQTWLNEIPFTGEPPWIGTVQLRLPDGYTSSLPSTNGVITVASGITDGAPLSAQPAMTPGYFSGGTFIPDPARTSPRALDWQFVDVPITSANGHHDLTAETTAPTATQLRKALQQSWGLQRFGAMVFDDKNRNGVMEADEPLINGVPIAFTENRASSTGAPNDSGWAGYPWGTWYSTDSGAVVDSGLSANPNQEIETTGWVDGSTPNSVRAAQWLTKYHTGALPSNYVITQRPANWQNTRFASQFDTDGTFDPSTLPSKHVVEPYGTGDLPLHIGYFNGGHFVADPDCNDPRSQLWEMPLLGIAKQAYTDSVAGAVESRAKFSANPDATTEPGFRVFIDADRNGVWDPATEQLADGLPIALETCSRDPGSLNWNCENLENYNAATTARGIIGGAYGTQAGDLWTQEIPLTGHLGLDDPAVQMVGRGGLRYIPPGLEVTTKDAEGANHLRTSWADADGMVQTPEDPNDTSNWETGYFLDGKWYSTADWNNRDTTIWQFYNIGLRPKTLDTAVTVCDAAATCPRGARAVLTITNNTGVTHREVKPTLRVMVGGRQVLATCTAVARLAAGESTTCAVDWKAQDADTQVSAEGNATSSMRFASTRYAVTAKPSTAEADLVPAPSPSVTPSPSTTPTVTPSTTPTVTPAPTPTVTPTPSQEPTAPQPSVPTLNPTEPVPPRPLPNTGR